MFHLRFTILLAIVSIAFAQTAPDRYTLILEDPPVAERFPSGEKMRSAEAAAYRKQIEASQKTVRDELAKRKIKVTGSISTVQNAIFVIASPQQAAELKSMPGVKDVVPQKRYKMN